MSYDSAPVANGIQAAPAASPAPAAPPEPAVSPEPEAPAAVEGAQLSRGTALLAVEVPAGTKIYVNGIKTKAEGSQRKYMSSGLIPGRSYQYLVQAVLERGGKQRAITKRVTLTAGSEAKIQFVFTDAVQPDALLTFYVPDEASVN